MNTKLFRQYTVIFGLFALFAGCGGNKTAKRDPFFEKWQTMAENSLGHSPVKSTEKIIVEGDAGTIKTDVHISLNNLPQIPVTFKLWQTDIKIVLRTMAQLADQNIIFKSDIKGEVNLDFKDVPWAHAFTSILTLHGLNYVWSGNLIKVLSSAEMENEINIDELKISRQAREPMVTTVIKINFADIKRLKDNLIELLIKDPKDNKARGIIKIDEDNNSLIIQTTKNDLNKMIPIIESIDKPIAQVHIQAAIVEASKETARDLGIQWGGMYSGKVGNSNLMVTPGGTTTKGITPPNPLSGGYSPVTGAPGLSGQGSAANFPVRNDIITKAGGAGSLGLMVGTFGGNILDLQLTALQQEGKVNILSRPSITTLDNQMAFTEHGEKVPFVTTTQASGGATTQTVSFENAVLRLEIIPHVIDGKSMKMKILVKKDEVDLSRQVQGNPFIIKKQTETVLIVADGETIVISGLSKQKNSSKESGWPWLKDIPFLGWLFKSSSKGDSMEEVLIFITPRILPPQIAVASKKGI